MTAEGIYTTDQIEMVRLQTAPATDKNKKKALAAAAAVAAAAAATASGGTATVSTSNASSGNGPTPPVQRAAAADNVVSSSALMGWKAGASSMPPGWRIKRHEYANQTVYFYMSPKGDIIKSRRGVIDYMLDDGSYAEKDFNIVIGGAKQRKVALQELYDSRTKLKNSSGNRMVRKKQQRATDDPDPEELELADSVQGVFARV